MGSSHRIGGIRKATRIMGNASFQKRTRKEGGVSEFLSLARLACPAIAALGIAQATLGVSVYGNASYAEDPVMPNLSTVIGVALVLPMVVALAASRKPLPRKAPAVLASCGILIQISSPFLLASVDSAIPDPGYAGLGLFVLSVIGNLLVVTHWLRSLRDLPRRAVALIAFSAICLNEVISLPLAFLPHSTACLAVGALSVLQIPLALLSRAGKPMLSRIVSGHPDATHQTSGYLQLMESKGGDTRFLAPNLLAALVVSIVIGLLWGFPDGHANLLPPLGRALCTAFAVAMSLLVARKVGAPSKVDDPASVWVVIQILGISSFFLYALLPDIPTLGMMCLYALNSVTSAFIWCVAAALMRSGRFDPHCYGLGGLAVFLLPGSAARVATMVSIDASLAAEGALAWPHFPWDTLIAGVLGVLILLPVQLIMAAAARVRASDEARTGRLLEGLTHALGLEGEAARPVDVRKAFMDRAVKCMRYDFGLSEREADVLSLYALGMTQSKIAEELHVSTSTVHTHIAHIYSKTALHSRQELMDCLDERMHPDNTPPK